MTKTVTSLFQSEQHATDAARRVEEAGIPRDSIDIWTTPHNLAPLLEDLGVSRSDAYAYVEGVLRGGTVVIVKCDGPKVHQVVEILDREGVLDLDEQRTSWHSEGWQEPAGAEASGSLAGTTERPEEVTHGRVRIQIVRTERSIEE